MAFYVKLSGIWPCLTHGRRCVHTTHPSLGRQHCIVGSACKGTTSRWSVWVNSQEPGILKVFNFLSIYLFSLISLTFRPMRPCSQNFCYLKIAHTPTHTLQIYHSVSPPHCHRRTNTTVTFLNNTLERIKNINRSE